MKKKFLCTPCTNLLLKKLKNEEAKQLDRNALMALHVGKTTQLKIENGALLNLCQFYVALRCDLTGYQPATSPDGTSTSNSRQHTNTCPPSHNDRLRMIARVFDALEHDYAECYGSGGAPFPNGCENFVNEIIKGWLYHNIQMLPN